MLKYNKLLLAPIFFIFLFSLSFISAFDFTSTELLNLGTFKQNDCVTLYQTCASCSYVNLTSVKLPNGTIVGYNDAMTKDGSEYSYDYCNTSLTGQYFYTIKGDKGGTEASEVILFEITLDGNANNLQRGLISISLIFFFILLGFGFYSIHSKVNLEKWNNSLLKRYENKNYVKLVLGSIVYNILKNPFIIYYLIGFPVIVGLTDLSYAYGLGNFLSLFEALIVIYSVGVFIVGLIFFSYVQEWLVDLLEKIRDMDWGTE
jgi:hypothetical protein